MSAGAPSGDDDTGQDFDLNLAPIIDCFTVLITYMLVSASFISLQVIEVSAVAVADSAPPTEVPLENPQSLSAELKAGSIIELHVSGRAPAEYVVGLPGAQDWDLNQLSAQLNKIRKQWPEIKEVSVKAEPAIRYKQIVRVIEGIRKDIPKVMVGE